jgi:hypothetical protein
VEILLTIIGVFWAVSNLLGPIILISSLDEKDIHFLPIPTAKLLRKYLNLPGTIIAMIFICIWFSLVILTNIILIIGVFLLAGIIGLFYTIFKRKD